MMDADALKERLRKMKALADFGIGGERDAALQAVRNSCPFSHGAGRSLTLTVPIHFDLQ